MAEDLVGPAEILSGPFEIVDRSQRNTNYRISWSGGGLFVKEARDADRRATQAREAGIYRLAGGRVELAGIGAAMPDLLRYLPEPGLLVLRLETGAETCRDRATRSGRFSIRAAELAASFLADLHRVSRGLSRAELGLPPSRYLPLGLTLDAPGATILDNCSAGAIEVVAILRGSDTLCRLLPEARRNWRETALVHGDFRWQNCLLLPGRRRSLAGAFRVIDWELATQGDPAWDVACWIADYLGLWVQSIPVTPSLAAAGLIERHCRQSQFTPEAAHAPIAAFWERYLRRSGTAGALLDRTIRYVIARLCQSAFEWSSTSPAPASHAFLALQVAENIARDPDAAVLHLLGLAPDRGSAAA